MFGIDFSEILVIFGIALIVLGPEKLPRLARTIGHWVGRARAMARQFREQLEQESDALHRSADLRSAMGANAPPPQPPPPTGATTTAATTAAPMEGTVAASPVPAVAPTLAPAASPTPPTPSTEANERTG
jgi:sec-independent protein translocase protein TatB